MMDFLTAELIAPFSSGEKVTIAFRDSRMEALCLRVRSFPTDRRDERCAFWERARLNVPIKLETYLANVGSLV